MYCPTLSELLIAPRGKQGWPWSEQSPQLPEALPTGDPWPRISIITPSYNQSRYVETPMFVSVGGAIVYCRTRHFKPRKIYEIGSGYSTYFSAQAV